ncbi:MAG: arabinan endo-1,5-alpha-L-arabinosidase, partial [Planctomycetia bacterium]|nr:arabinan endo-1,5-alpha-L-arabinosidase [Planctomycetia bacterium]
MGRNPGVYGVWILILITGWVRGSDDGLAVIRYDSPDPTAIEAPDGSVYVFTTHRGIAISRSRDLVHWERIGRVFPEPVPSWAKERIPGARLIWAPDITFHHGRYHLYYCVSTFGSQRSVIGLATNVTLDPGSPDYRWEDQGLVLESAPEFTDYNAIDPALFVDDDGRTYLYWGSYWRGLRAIEVDPGTGKPTTYRDPGEVGGLRIPRGEVIVAKRAEGGDTSIEAAYVIRRGSFYWLFTSRG